MTGTQTQPRRPGVVTFIGVILYIQAFVALVAAISLLIWQDDVADYLETQGAAHITDGQITGTVIGEFIVAVLLFLVAAGIMRGSRVWRFLVAVAQAFAMGVAIYALVSQHVGGYVYRSVFTLAVGIFVLWALYGNDESEEYFGST